MKKLLAILILLLSFQYRCYSQKQGQEKIDSLFSVLSIAEEDTGKVNTLDELVNEFRYSNVDTAMYFVKEALALATKLNYEKGIADSKLMTGALNASLGKNDEGLKAANEALVLYNKLLPSATGSYKEKILAKIGRTYNVIGHNRTSQGNYPEALKNFFLALKKREEAGDQKGVNDTENNIGTIYFIQHNYPEALKHYYTALKVSEQLGYKADIATNYNMIAYVYLEQGNNPEAMKNFSAALKFAKEAKDKTTLADVYNYLGIVNYRLGNYSEALKYDFLALKGNEEAGIDEQLPDIYNNIGLVYMKQKKYNDASEYLNKALSYSKEIGTLASIQLSYESMTILDSTQGNFKESLEHYKLAIASRDSAFNKENTKKLVQQQMQYDFDKKESLTKAEQEKKDAEARRTKNIQYFAIAALAILVLAVLIIAYIQWRNNMHRQKANLLLQQQKEKVESTLSELKATQTQLIQSEKMASLGELTAGIAHEIQNPLNFVNNFSEVNKEMIAEMKDEIDKGNYNEVKIIANDIEANEEKINHHGKRADAIVKGMLQHSSSHSGIKEATNINKLADEYLRLAYHGLKAKDKSFSATLKTDFDETIGNIQVIPQDIGRVLLNLINNAFYAVAEKRKQTGEDFEPTVSVQTKKSDNNVLISVKDNGNGIPQKVVDKIFQPFFTTKPTGQGTGLGLSLAYDIVKAHGGEIRVGAKESEGTVFIIQLPV
jgi:two-component system, NtrC family, sensor kinase